MKRFNATLISCALVMFGGVAMASPMSLTQFKPQVMPVLVEVNAQGHVTRVLPSVELTPKFQQLLTKDIGEWITGPAMVKHRAVGSQLIMNVSLRTTPRNDGKYDASFAYVSSLPSPFGAGAHWVTKDGIELALVSDSGALAMGRVIQPYPVNLASFRPVGSQFASSAMSQQASAKPSGAHGH